MVSFAGSVAREVWAAAQAGVAAKIDFATSTRITASYRDCAERGKGGSPVR